MRRQLTGTQDHRDAVAPALPPHLEKYREYVDAFELSDRAKDELLQTLWNMMSTIVDCSWNEDSVQAVLQARVKTAAVDGFTNGQREARNCALSRTEEEMLDTEERAERWLKVSLGLMRFEKHMTPLVQQLGRLDVRLIQADEAWPDRFLNGELSYEDSLTLHEHITLSFLWVLGAYEFLRTLYDRVRTGTEKTPEEVRNSLLDAKRRFARVCVPLAKWRRHLSSQMKTGQLHIPG